jgi:hypothetical protein
VAGGDHRRAHGAVVTIVYCAFVAQDVAAFEAADFDVDVLVAWQELRVFLERRDRMRIRRWCLDSGAFMALSRGKPVDFDAFCEFASTCGADEVFGLDVIGDPEATMRNLEAMWKLGINAIPTFHFGAPWEVLQWAAHRDKIALGGMAPFVARRSTEVTRFVEQCFARVWPKKIHGFGVVRNSIIDRFPFHSVDASSWSFAPKAFHRWTAFTGTQERLPAKRSSSLVPELRQYAARGERLAFIHRGALSRLDHRAPG